MDLKKGHTIDQKEFLDLKYLLFSGIGGYTSPSLNGKSFCPKTLSGIGGYRKKALSSILRLPLLEGIFRIGLVYPVCPICHVFRVWCLSYHITSYHIKVTSPVFFHF